MKTLKFKHYIVNEIMSGQVFKTWRLFDDKQLELDDTLQLIDSDSGKDFGYAKITKITTKHIAEINEEDMLGHVRYANIEDILKDFRKFYGFSVDENTPVKIISFDFFNRYPPIQDVNKSTLITEVKIYTDGGSRGNPGPSACSYVIIDKAGNMVKKDGVYLGITTNNQAEYQAALRSLRDAHAMGVKVAHIFMDSLLVVNQMNGIYKVRNRDLWPIHSAIKDIALHFQKVTFTHIPRELNKIADSQVNEILDGQEKDGIRSELL